MEQSSEQPSRRLQSATSGREPRRRDAGLLGGPLDPRPQSRTIRLFLLFPNPIRRPPQPPPHRHPQRRPFLRTPHPHRVHVQRGSERGVLSTVRAAQDRRESQSEGLSGDDESGTVTGLQAGGSDRTG